MLIIYCLHILKGIPGSFRKGARFPPLAPQKADMVVDIGIRATLSLVFNWVWSVVSPHRRSHEWVSKVWYFISGSFPVRWPWAGWVPKPVITVLLEAATLCVSPVSPGTCFLPSSFTVGCGCGGDSSAAPYPVPALPLVEPHPPNSHPCTQPSWKGNLLEMF